MLKMKMFSLMQNNNIFRHNIKRAALLCALFFLCLPLQAQDYEMHDVEGNPREILTDSTFKVGLVLSGGGAKGIAHVGVIKALEENNIPIDCVAGTSMGAIVSSLYACGYSPEEMMALFTSEGFGYWSSGTIDRNLVYYETMPEPTPQWLSVDLDFRNTQENNIGSQIIPSNLISPLPMNIEFLKLYAPYTEQCGGNFNKLFVPLRTVCSDVYHKHKIVCYKGSLGDAVRASMSFPLVFKPIEMDGVLVYDGGIYDNFPVDVMHEDFNPDFMIGVSVSGPDKKPEPDDIYSQLEDMIIQNNNYDLPEQYGVKIQVPVLDFGVLDWSEAITIYEIGYKTGLAMVDSIKQRCPYRIPESEVNRRREAFRSHTPVLEFDSIVVKGALPKQAEYLADLFRGGRKDDRPIDINQVENAYYRAVTSGKLNNLVPQASFGKDGNVLILDASVKNPWSVGLGGWITSSTHSMLYISFGFKTLNLNSLDLNLEGWLGQSYYAGMISGRISLPASNPSSLCLTGVISRQKYYESELLFYQDNTPASINELQEYLRLEYSVATGRPAKAYVNFSAGRLVDNYFLMSESPQTGRDLTKYHSLALKGGYEYNTLSNLLYPMSGRLTQANVIGMYERSKFLPADAALNADPSYAGHFNLSVEAEWKNFYPVHKNFIIGGMAKGVATLAKLYQNYVATLIHAPAFAPTPSTKNYFNTAFRADNYVAAGVIPIWNPLQKLQVRGDFYLYSPIRNLKNEGMTCRYDGWFRKAEFLGEVAAVYNFKFASLSLYCNYLSYPAHNWNFGINFGLLFQAPKFAR